MRPGASRETRRTVLGCLAVAGVLAACGGGGGGGDPRPEPSVTVTGGPVGERVVELRDLYLAEDGPGVRVAFHPASNSLQARVPDLPPAGVEVCSADVGGSVNDGGCTLILSSDTTPVPVAFSGGGAFHVAVVIRSPKGRATTVGAIHLTYQAADDFFDVTFPSGRSGSGSG